MNPRPKHILIVSVVIFIFGLMMLAYWLAYIVRGMPLEGIPLASELGNAVLALITAYGLFRMKRWSYPAGFVLAGMWIYGVLGGINLVLMKGLDFSSPVGARADAILFVLVLAFSIYLIARLWRDRRLFTSGVP
jgi:hypothetical protein